MELKKGAPPGYIREPLVLVTNDADARSARVPVNIEGLGHRRADGSPRVAGDGRGGNRQAGHEQSRRARACAVPCCRIHSSDGRFEGKLPAGRNLFHIIPITFLAKDAKTEPGKVNAKIRIETDLVGAEAVEVGASVEVVPEK